MTNTIKKIIAASLAILILAGCGAGSPKQTSESKDSFIDSAIEEKTTTDDQGKTSEMKETPISKDSMSQGKGNHESSKVSKTTEALDAYSGFLREWRRDYDEPKFQLAYIDEDDVPELLVSTDNSHVTGVAVYTFYNGKVMKLVEPKNAFAHPGLGFGQWGTLEYVPRKNIIRDYYFFTGEGAYIAQFFEIYKGSAVLIQSFEHDRYKDTYYVGGKVVPKGIFDSKKKKFRRKYACVDYMTTMSLTTDSNIRRMVKSPSEFVKEIKFKRFSLT